MYSVADCNSTAIHKTNEEVGQELEAEIDMNGWLGLLEGKQWGELLVPYLENGNFRLPKGQMLRVHLFSWRIRKGNELCLS